MAIFRAAISVIVILTVFGTTIGSIFAQDSRSSRASKGSVAFSLGYFDVVNQDDTALEVRAEYRSDYNVLIFKPFGGATLTSDLGFLLYAGIYSDFKLGDRFYLTPSVAPAYFNRGDGKDLGYELEFRSQIELSYRLRDDARIGLSFNHISNAGLGDTNNGSESIAVTYSFPLY